MEKAKEFCLRSLAEAIILQAAEDLWNEDYRRQSIAFFCKEGFRNCAKLAEMTLVEQAKLLRMLKGVLKEELGEQREFSDTAHIRHRIFEFSHSLAQSFNQFR